MRTANVGLLDVQGIVLLIEIVDKVNNVTLNPAGAG